MESGNHYKTKIKKNKTKTNFETLEHSLSMKDALLFPIAEYLLVDQSPFVLTLLFTAQCTSSTMKGLKL